MRSRPARLTLSVLAWIALGTATYFAFQQQQQIDGRRMALRNFESTARDAADALDDLHASQQAYVALGQDPSEWTPRVTTYLQTAASSIDTLRATALSSAAGPSLLDASTAMTQVGSLDRGVREQLGKGETAAAADAVFGELTDAISSAVSNIDAAITAEQQAADEFEATLRRAQVYALGGAGGLVAVLLAIFGLAPSAGRTEESIDARDTATQAMASPADATVNAPAATSPIAPPPAVTASDAALETIARLCTEFGRVRDASQIKLLLEQAAALMNARGVIVWLGTVSGGDLRPVLAHGYSDVTLAHLSNVPRSADNAAAAAYRSGELQIVKSRPEGSQGAVVAPMLSGDGCIGALTAEIRDRGEQSGVTRAVAVILAAQLAGVLSSAAESPVESPAPDVAGSQAAAS